MRLAVDAVIARVPRLLRYIVAALALCGLILAIVQQRAAILQTGQEVRLDIVPVDPRNLFRGDYVILSYRIGTVATPVADAPAFKRGQQVYVTLRPEAGGLARAVGIAAEKPVVSGEDIVIAGLVSVPSVCALNEDGTRDCKNGARAVGVRYGLESYFVPQGEGRRIERTQKARLEVVVAVAPSGQAAVKRLLIDGKPLYTEPLY